MIETPSFRLIVPELPKLPNRLLGAHWRTRSGHSARWKKLVGQSLWVSKGDQNKKCELPLEKAHLKCFRKSPRACDFDGLVGSFKPIIDALVHHAILKDDSMACIDVEYIWEKTVTKKQGIMVEVYGGNRD